MPTKQVNEIQLLRRLEENDRLFSCRFRALLAGTFRRIRSVVGETQPIEKLLAIERAEQRRLEKFLADEVTAVFAIGEAHAALLCREKIKKFEKNQLAAFVPWFLSDSIRRLVDLMNVDPKDFWLKPKKAIEAFKLRENMLAKDVSGALWQEVKPIMAEHYEGVSRKETLAKLEKLQGVTERRAELIVTTESTYAYNRGRLAGFKKAEVDYVRFSAVMDARTSPQCRSRHGKVMRIDSAELAHNTPPLHGRCRSVLSPLYSRYEPEEITAENTDWSKVSPLPKNWRTGGTAAVEKTVTPAPPSDIIKEKHIIVEGKNVAGQWKRRPDKFKNEIDDIVNHQGFDGKPRIVGEKEFVKLVEADHFIGQRVYCAESKEILAEYKQSLRDGQWYIDCAKGGSQYGQGLYCAADYTKGLKMSGVADEMQHYKNMGNRRGRAYYHIETLTLDKSAKVLTLPNVKITQRVDLIRDLAAQYINQNPEMFGLDKRMISSRKSLSPAELEKQDALYFKAWRKLNEDMFKRRRDPGAVAAELGYDAINATGHGKSESYTVILNRTKLILLEE